MKTDEFNISLREIWNRFLRQEYITEDHINILANTAFGLSIKSSSDIPTCFQEYGIQIETHEQKYRCVDALFQSEVLSMLSGKNVCYTPECESTNIICRNIAVEPNSVIDVVATGYQTSGRGRLNRNWYSNPDENLLFSMIVRPNIPSHLAPRCTLIWAAAVAKELDFWVKWPNDIFSKEGRKIGGILCEASFESNRVSHLIVGIGINVHQTDFPPDTVASSLQREWKTKNISKTLILTRLIRTIFECDVSQSMDFHKERSFVLGKTIRVGDIQGVAEEIYEDGTLIISGKAIYTGDVQVLNEIYSEDKK